MSFALSQKVIYDYSKTILENSCHILSRSGNSDGLSRCTFRCFNPLFRLFFCFRLVAVNRCFVDCHKISSKFIWISLKQLKIVFISDHLFVYLVSCKQTPNPDLAHFADSIFIWKCSCKILCTRSFEIPTAVVISCIFNLRSSITIS
ncbi:hypothetical protein WN55_08224 [Dufourea novaeangliae]|uniref:Uncharacterized protein n=1 Tax=Dufourea novaeangliae TaxID=178035 RepID=A0A154PT32_DUFNO|nr:hypothetical protein WN55_08224 [Dufourea novaeangliae]